MVLLRAALPALLEWAIPWAAASRAGVRAEVANIDLALIAGEVTLDDLRVGLLSGSESEPPSDIETVLLQIERLHVALDWRDLFARRVHIVDLTLEAPRAGLVQRADGSLLLPTPPARAANGESFEAPAAPADEPPGAAERSRGWEFALDRFELSRAVVTLRSAEGEEEVLRFAAESIGLGSLLLAPEGIELAGVTLERPELSVERAWLLAQGGGESDEAPAAEAVEPIRISVKHLEVNSAGFTVRTRKGPLDVAIRLKVDDAGTAPGQMFPVELELRIGEGTITATGQLGIAPLVFDGRLVWSDLAVPPVLLITNPGLLPWIRSIDSAGELELAVRTQATKAAPAGVRAKGVVQVADVSFADPESGELALAWERLDLRLHSAFWPLAAAADSAPRIEIERLELLAPEVVYTRPPEALERLVAALGGSAEAASDSAEAPAEAARPTFATIDSLEISDGRIRFADRSVTPNHETLIRDLRVVGAGLASEPVAAARSIEVTGRIQEAAVFVLKGALPEGNGELGFDLSRLDLVPYAPFASDAGWLVRSGESTLNSVIEIQGDRYEARNELVLHDLDIDQEDPSRFAASFGVPLDVALALLRDPSGDIELSIPVTLSGEGVGVDAGTVVASALREALAGALLSPFKILGALVPDGGGPVSFEPLAFEPGASEIGRDVGKRVKRLSNLLSERPRLGLTLVGRSAPADRPALARASLREKAVAGEDFPGVDGAGLLARRRVVAAMRDPDGTLLAELTPGDRDLLRRYVAAQPVSDERLRALAKARANNVREALVRAGVGSDVVRIGDSETAGDAAVALKLTSRAMSNDAAQ